MSVVVQSLTRHYAGGNLPAVDGCSFEAPRGAITALLGPSGSGKTTVLRSVAGLELPDAGAILLDGVDVTRVPARERGVGFVFQSYALFANMTVRDNIAFGLSLRRERPAAIAARVDELLELIQLPDLGDRYPRQLSGGQQQRVALARALATRPKVLLLDEPFGALDARVRVELRDWLHRLHEQMQVTTLMVTHDQDEALELSQHVVVMNNGRIEQAGSPAELYDHPATPFVASFVGGASVIKGKVEGGRASLSTSMSVVAPTGSQEGADVSAFVRPHDIRIARVGPNAAPGSLGRVGRVIRVGGYVKVDITLPSGDSVGLQMPRPEFLALGVGEGDPVQVDLRSAQVFVEDYAI